MENPEAVLAAESTGAMQATTKAAFAPSREEQSEVQWDAVPAALASLSDAELTSVLERVRAVIAVTGLAGIILAFLWSLM